MKFFPDAKSLPFKVLELDLQTVVDKKINVIQSKPKFHNFCKSNFTNFKMEQKNSQNCISSDQYVLRGCDLNNIEDLGKIIIEENFDLTVPTFIMSECVLVYLEPMGVRNILRYFSSNFEQCLFMEYEMFNPNSNFGKMMMKNFTSRGVPLIGIENYQSLEGIHKMNIEEGFDECTVKDMDIIFRHWLPKAEMTRIRKLEFLDELEELNLIQSHYFISIAKKSKKSLQFEGKKDENSDWFQKIGFESISS